LDHGPSAPLASKFRDLVTAHYSSVTFYGSASCSWSSADASLTVTHTNGALGTSKLADQILSCDYLIQMPIHKRHVADQGLYTITYKNLLGLKARATISALHNNLQDASTNPLVDLYANTNIINKTKLIIGDSIYGGSDNNWGAPAVGLFLATHGPRDVSFQLIP